jgi:hypothetical protein
MFDKSSVLHQRQEEAIILLEYCGLIYVQIVIHMWICTCGNGRKEPGNIKYVLIMSV